MKKATLGKLIWVLGIVAVAIFWLQSPDWFWKYLFLLRVPIVMGAFLLLLPKLAKDWLPAMLKNLFVLRGRWQLAFVFMSAIAAGMAVSMSGAIILHNAADRFQVPPPIQFPEFWENGMQYVMALVLSVPLCWTAFELSRENTSWKIPNHQREWGAITGTGFGLGMLVLVALMRQWLRTNTELKGFLTEIIRFFSKQEMGGYLKPSGELALGHLSGFAFLLIGSFIYAVIGWYFQPKPKSGREEAPALLYLLLILTIFSLVLPGATFYFDYFRVPVLILFVIFSAISYAVFNVNHYFALIPVKRDDSQVEHNQNAGDFKTAIDQRLQHQTGPRTLVVVCASGGGIQAAGWTTQVLTGLQALLGTSFTQAIGMLSSVSGGSVGALYYLDRFGDHGYPEPLPNGTQNPENSSQDYLGDIFNRATRDSLDAVGWGLAYRDLWRFIGLPFVVNPHQDRGTAIETDWQGELASGTHKTLGTWRKEVLAGKIPIPIFNATLVEDGNRFLITPMTFSQSHQVSELTGRKKQCLDFNTLYGQQGYDLDVVTAARLSSTFPYVSPICRNSVPLKRNYHVADGGYFDNSGLVTAMEWLDEWLAPEKGLGIKQVLILQINPFPNTPSNENQQGASGWFMTTLGPLLTTFKVRDPVLADRNRTEAYLLQKRWENQVDIRYYPIFFPQLPDVENVPIEMADLEKLFNEKGQYRPPLSWKLTDAEKQALRSGWNLIAHPQSKLKEAKVIQALKQLWLETWKMPSGK